MLLLSRFVFYYLHLLFTEETPMAIGGLVEIVLMAWLLKRVPEVRNYVNERSDFSIGQWFEL